MMKNILITGGAGFIGSNLIDYLIEEGGWNITCLDNFDNFYPPEIKRNNIAKHLTAQNFQLIQSDICNYDELSNNLSDSYNIIVHLAAKAGVRPSIDHPLDYEKVNVLGTNNLLEIARKRNISQFIFSSSSSVYGINDNVPWSESDFVLKPISPYAATKVSCELLGHTYSHLFGIRFLALRLFTVYGKRQRPDLAIHKFSKSIMKGEPIVVYGVGETARDYTYVDDIVAGIRSAMEYDKTQFEIINLGNNNIIKLSTLISYLEKIFQKKAIIKYLPEQPGDVPLTCANIEKGRNLLGYMPKVPLERGLALFKEWLINGD